MTAAGNFLTGAAGGGSGATALATRVASRSASGAAAGGFGGAINTGLTGGDIGDHALSGAMVGGAIGAALPVAGAAARGTVNRLTGATSPELAQLARSAQERGFPVRAAEISNSPLVLGADAALSKIPGMGSRKEMSTSRSRNTTRLTSTSDGYDEHHPLHFGGHNRKN
ncbi:hypothetical protein [Methylorubrum thiocyanatum]